MEVGKAVEALRFVIPLLEKYTFRWVITGGFASLVYGVQRPLTDIDIDVDTSAESADFKSFVKDIEPYISLPLGRFSDQNYDNMCVEATYAGQVLDICPMAELMMICNKNTGKFEHLYKDGFPNVEIINFHGFQLPLLPKESIIRTKEMLVWQRESDHRDVAGLRAILHSKTST